MPRLAPKQNVVFAEEINHAPIYPRYKIETRLWTCSTTKAALQEVKKEIVRFVVNMSGITDDEQKSVLQNIKNKYANFQFSTFLSVF